MKWYVCVNAHLQTHACMCVHTCGGQRLMLDVFLSCSPPYFFEIVSYEAGVTQLGCVTSELGISARLPLKHWDYRHT